MSAVTWWRSASRAGCWDPSTRRVPEYPHQQVWGYQPNHWRLIVDLSYPDGASINDGISKELCSLQYIKIDQVAEVAIQHGRGAVLGKNDIKNAYRVVPVHPSNCPLLGMRWEGKEYVDSALPFGLRLAPMQQLTHWNGYFNLRESSASCIPGTSYWP